jgi:hypothetical protein
MSKKKVFKFYYKTHYIQKMATKTISITIEQPKCSINQGEFGCPIAMQIDLSRLMPTKLSF